MNADELPAGAMNYSFKAYVQACGFAGDLIISSSSVNDLVKSLRLLEGLLDLGHLGGDYSQAFGINKYGQVVGRSSTPNYTPVGGRVEHAFLWTIKKGLVDLGCLPGHDFCGAYDINDNGKVVGNSAYSASSRHPLTHAFIWDKKAGMVEIDPHTDDTFIRTATWDINNNSLILGYKLDVSSSHVLWTPDLKH